MAVVTDIKELAFHRHADELAATWQARALRGGLRFDRGLAFARDKLGLVLLSVLGHNYSDPREDALRTLLMVVCPGFQSIAAPFLCSAGKIAKTGHVMADMITTAGERVKNQALFRGTSAMQSQFRRFADGLHLDDDEREEMFAALRRWVVCDYRIDPTMNPADPDAKRLTVH